MNKVAQTFNEAVIARGDGTFGTLTVKGGNVSKGTTTLLSFFGEKSVLIPLNARQTFTVAAEHAAFDGLLFALMAANITVNYVNNISTFLNPDLRFREFLGMSQADAKTMNDNFGLGLTADELRVAALTKSARDKFTKVFFMEGPAIPDLKKLFPTASDNQIKSVEKWLSGKITANQVLKPRLDNSKTQNLLRVYRTTVQNLNGYSITINQFKTGYAQIRKALDHGQIFCTVSNIARYDYHNLSMTMDGQVVSIGCQEHPLSEVLRIAQELGL